MFNYNIVLIQINLMNNYRKLAFTYSPVKTAIHITISQNTFEWIQKKLRNIKLKKNHNKISHDPVNKSRTYHPDSCGIYLIEIKNSKKRFIWMRTERFPWLIAISAIITNSALHNPWPRRLHWLFGQSTDLCSRGVWSRVDPPVGYRPYSHRSYND